MFKKMLENVDRSFWEKKTKPTFEIEYFLFHWIRSQLSQSYHPVLTDSVPLCKFKHDAPITLSLLKCSNIETCSKGTKRKGSSCSGCFSAPVLTSS